MNRSARCCTPTATIASRALAQSTSEPEPHREMYGVRPISTNSRTENGNAGITSCGTTATSRAASRPVSENGSSPVRWTAPADGCKVRDATRTSVVFPHPFGPTNPTTSPASTERSTPRRASIDP